MDVRCAVCGMFKRWVHHRVHMCVCVYVKVCVCVCVCVHMLLRHARTAVMESRLPLVVARRRVDLLLRDEPLHDQGLALQYRRVQRVLSIHRIRLECRVRPLDHHLFQGIKLPHRRQVDEALAHNRRVVDVLAGLGHAGSSGGKDVLGRIEGKAVGGTHVQS